MFVYQAEVLEPVGERIICNYQNARFCNIKKCWMINNKPIEF